MNNNRLFKNLPWAVNHDGKKRTYVIMYTHYTHHNTVGRHLHARIYFKFDSSIKLYFFQIVIIIFKKKMIDEA